MPRSLIAEFFESSPALDPALKHPNMNYSNYVITDTTISRNLLYQKLNHTDKIFCEYSFYDGTLNEYMLATAVRKAVGEDNLYYCEFGFPGDKKAVREDDWDSGDYLFTVPAAKGGVDVIHKKGHTVHFVSSDIESAAKLRETYTKKINAEIKKLTKTSSFNDKISLLMKSDTYYFSSVKINIDNVKDLDLDLHYGEGFKKKSDAILENLKNKHKGIYLFHGKMGAGKTSFLRYLTSQIHDKKVIFIPPYFTDFLSSPEFLPTLISDSGARNSILIIEDAEKAVIAREDGNSSGNAVAALLSLGDGVLSDVANCQIICTFNTRVENIDSALLRKGRLIAELNFEALSITDSQRLVDKLAEKGEIKHFTVKKEMTLAEIYGAEQDNFHKEKEERKIGFGR